MPQRARQGRRPVARRLRRRAGGRARADRREDDPQAPRGHDAAARRAAPGADTALAALADALETRDRQGRAASTRIPGWRPFQRLNRAEYQQRGRAICSRSTSTSTRSCRPTRSATGFDNVADVQAFSPTLMEGYLRAASRVTALAVGDADGRADARRATACRRPRRSCSASKARRSARAAACRSCTRSRPTATTSSAWSCTATPCGFLFGGPASGEQVEMSIDGDRKALVDIDPRMADVDDRAGAEDAADSRHRRRASRDRRVHPALRRPGQRSDRADRPHAGRHADRRRLRHHDAAAPARTSASSGRTA